MMGAMLAVLLRRRVARLSDAALARLGAGVALRWVGFGDVTHDAGSVRLRGPGVQRLRRGRRDRLPEADLLWPGDGL